MRAIGLAILLLAAGALGGPGQLYVTDFGRRILYQTDQIVVAKVSEVRSAFRGITTARLQVEERIQGFDRDKQILLLYVEDFAAPDAFGSTLESSTIQFERRRKARLLRYMEDRGTDRSGESGTAARQVNRKKQKAGGPGPDDEGARGVRFAVGERALFFLRRKGASYSMVGIVPARDPLFEVKRERLIEVLRLESIPSVQTRAKDAKFFFSSTLRSDDIWVRGNSAREIMTLAIRFPEVFSRGEARGLTELLHAEKEPPIAASLERAVRMLDPGAAFAYAEKAEARERERVRPLLDQERVRLDALRSDDLKAADLSRVAILYGRASSVLISIYLTDEAPIVRERAARALAEYGGPSARVPLREALAREKEPSVIKALILGCGASGDPASIPGIVIHLENPELQRPALYALGAIGTKEAKAVIEGHRPRTSGEMRDLIDTILREEFPR